MIGTGRGFQRNPKALGANVVRVHLQLGRYMKNAKMQNLDQANLEQLAKLLKLAERPGCTLISRVSVAITVPKWYDKLEESERWNVQARFGRRSPRSARTARPSFAYNLMNEPVLPSKKNSGEWLKGELSGKYFVQRIALDLKGRSRKEIAKAWVAQLSSAIREVDPKHMITVGVIPWALTFKEVTIPRWASSLASCSRLRQRALLPKKSSSIALKVMR